MAAALWWYGLRGQPARTSNLLIFTCRAVRAHGHDLWCGVGSYVDLAPTSTTVFFGASPLAIVGTQLQLLVVMVWLRGASYASYGLAFAIIDAVAGDVLLLSGGCTGCVHVASVLVENNE